MTITTVQVDTIQTVYSDNARTPLIGPDNPDGTETFAPWKWDERIWTSEFFENSELAIPVLGDQVTRGIPEDYWQSGVGNNKIDLEVLGPVELRQESQERWTVDIRHGDYYKLQESRYLFSNRSQVQFVDNAANETSRNVLQLAVAPAYDEDGTAIDSESPRFGSPVLALMWTRNKYDEPVLYRSIQKRTQFTGTYNDDNEEQSTVNDDGDIIWSAVDTSRKEFVVQWTGAQTTPPKLYFNQDYTFLVGRTTVSDADDLEFCDFLGDGQGAGEDQVLFTKHFPLVDNSELTLYKLVGSVVTKLVRWESDYVSGVLPVPDYIIDTNRGEITFSSEVNDTNTDIIPPATDQQIYAVYRPTIEVEYEPESCNNFLTAPHINMSPIRTTTDRGFLYLTERELRVAYLELTADTTVISEDVYGPLFLGSDYCFLIATAYNNRGQPVPDVEVSFYLDDTDSGCVNGATPLEGSEVTATTDSEGRARVVYSTPRSIEAVGQYLKHESGTELQYNLTLVYTNGINSDNLDELFVYQVFNDDGMQPWYDELTVDGEPGHGGRKVVLYRRTVAVELGGGTGDEEASNRFAGDEDALHPRTGVAGDTTDVWMPLQPAEIAAGVLTFKDGAGLTVDLPWTVAAIDFDEEADPPVQPTPGNLVAYWVSGGKQVPAHAKCFSYLYNTWIDSNDIEFRVTIPEYLKGVYVNDDSKKIPYGFRLYDENSAASGLDGATFLSIHPAAGKWPILWDGLSLGTIEHPDPFIDDNIQGHKFTVLVP